MPCHPPNALRRARIAAALLIFALGACRTAPLPTAIEYTAIESTGAAAPTDATELLRLGPNDIVRARVYGHPELSTPESDDLTGTRVDPDGSLALPLVGSVAVGGLTLDEAREAIRAGYASFMKEPQVEVSVVEYAARRFYLFGEILKAGPIAFDRPLNVYQALTFGGGYSRHADRKRIVLLRERREGVDVHVIDGESPDESGLVALMPNDFLFVRRTGAGKFSEEVLPILSGVSSALTSIGSLILIDDRLDD